jgi:peptidoglycan/LPS O-acetylase OafA/YrhL
MSAANAAAFARETIGGRMAACGATSGFDYMRICLALAVLSWHAVPITQGREAADALLDGPLGPPVRLILPMFFALSGFLVTASLFRTPSIRVFLLFRALRIGPALAVEVALSALLLGPLFTTLALGTYFTAPDFFRYFTNAVGIVNYELPGVFADHPVTAVNGGLWTVPYELECYIALTVLYLLSFMRRPYFLLGATLAGGFVVGAMSFMPAISALGAEGANPFNYQNALDASVQPRRILVLSFLAGAVVYLFRERLTLNPLYAALAVVLGLALLTSPFLYGFAPLPIAYATVYLGLLNPPRHKLVLSGDYSYGVYLYAFPIQQMVYALGPGQSALANAALSTLAAALFAVFSWRLIERPALALRKRFTPKPGPA